MDSLSAVFDYIDLHTGKLPSVVELNKRLQGATTYLVVHGLHGYGNDRTSHNTLTSQSQTHLRLPRAFG